MHRPRQSHISRQPSISSACHLTNAFPTPYNRRHREQYRIGDAARCDCHKVALGCNQIAPANRLYLNFIGSSDHIIDQSQSSTSSSSAASAALRHHSAPPPPPLLLQLPPPLPSVSDLQATNSIIPSSQLIARRLISLARSFLALHHDHATDDPSDWELDLCSATFFSIYAVCLDSSSILARRTLARCARLGGFNIVLPFTPSGSSASASVSATKLSSQDSHDRAGAQACIHLLQQGSASTFQDAGSAREYRDACRTLCRSSEAVQVADVLQDKVLGRGRRWMQSRIWPRFPHGLVSESIPFSAADRLGLQCS